MITLDFGPSWFRDQNPVSRIYFHNLGLHKYYFNLLQSTHHTQLTTSTTVVTIES